MGRLTKYGKTSHDNGVCCNHFNSKECAELQGNCSYGCQWEEKVWEKLAHYEDLEEQGRLIELPCKVGEKIYRPINNHIIEFIVIGLIYDIIKDRWSYETVYQSGTDWRKGVCDFGLIGEIVFLTKEEAEAKLKEMRGAE